MNKLILEIEKMKSNMGIVNNSHKDLLFEATIPPDLWVKLTKYIDDLAGLGKRDLDDLVTRKLIDADELKWIKQNADEIKLMARNITNPSNLTDPMLKKYDNIIARLSKEDGEMLLKKAVSSYIDSNPRDFVAQKNLINVFTNALNNIEKGIVDSSNIKLVEYVQNGGKIVDLYKAELEKVYKGEVLDELVRRFKENPLFKDAEEIIINEGLSLEQILNREIKKLLEDPTYKDLTSLEKVAKLNELKDNFIKKTIARQSGKEAAEKTSEVEIKSIVDKRIKEEILNVSTGYTPEFFNRLFASGSNLPIIDDLFKFLNTAANGGKIIREQLERKVDDIIVSVEKTGNEQYYNDIAAKIKAYVAQVEAFKEGNDVFFKELQAKLKSAFPGDDTHSREIIEKINNFNELDEFLKKATQSVTPKQRFKENLEILRDSFRFKTPQPGDMEKTVLQFSKGALQRWSSFILTGTFRTFEEWSQRLAQKRSRFFAGKKVGGYNSKSYLDMYFRIWVTANVIVPAAYNFVTAILGFGVAILSPNTEFGKKYSELNIFEIAWNGWKDDMLDTFKSFTDIWNNFFGDVSPQSPNTMVDIAYDFFNVIIPFNTKVDDIITFLKDSNLLYNKIESTKKELTEKFEKENPELIEKFGNVKENPKGNIVLNIDVEKLDDYVKTLPDGEKESFLAIRYEKSLNQEEKKFIMRYAGGGEKETDTWVEIPNTGKKVKLNVADNDVYGTWVDDKGNNRPLKDLYKIIKKSQANPSSNNNGQNESYKITKKTLMENNGKKFGEDNFKHWKETFTFKSEDKNNPGQYKEVKLSMEDVMDRINHYRKKYDEDDAFVRAVVDTHEDVVKIMYTKGLADINESATPRGLALVLRTLNESRGEMEIFSVARPANGNWFLVKGDYTQSQLANMDLEKKEPKDKEEKKEMSGSEELKKKEQTAVELLKKNEKEGINDLPNKVREKLREKLGKGWTTETMPSFLEKFVEKSSINTIFNDKIEIYKLDSNDDTFDAIVDNSSQIFIKRGFCRSLYVASDKANLNEKQQKVVDHILNKCDKKFLGKLGVRNF
jgi:hypothetical protein